MLAHTTTAAAGTINAERNRVSANVGMESSAVGRGEVVCFVTEAAPVDAVAERGALDLQQFRRLRFVAAADFERPQDQIRLEFAQPIVERHRRGRSGSAGSDG